ncbi:MAG: DUF2341 domain-containing protein, partial [bacterium]|nr:DUF2341 domain-containing protein [bacterium]
MSTIADFNNQFKKMHPNVSVATDVTDQTAYNFAKNNPFKRQITLNNLTKTLKTDYLISFKLDTRAMYLLNDCSWTFADLRVYDTNETTELNFWVEASNTPYTTIFVRVPTIAADANKNIWLYYGNPGLKNKANLTETCGDVFTSFNLKAWMKGNDVNRVLGGGLPNGQAVNFWDNKVNRQNNAVQIDSTKRPAFLENQINGLPEVSFDGTNDDINIPGVVIIPASTFYHIFSVAGRSSSKVGNFFLGDDGAAVTNGSLNFGWNSSTVFNFAQFGNDLTFTVPAYTSKVFELWDGRLIS